MKGVVKMGLANKSGAQFGGLRRTLLELSLGMLGTSVILCSLIGGVIHLYATFLAFQTAGFGAALLTFAVPFFAELYWIVFIWSQTGVFWSGLTIAAVSYLVLCIMTITAGLVAASHAASHKSE